MKASLPCLAILQVTPESLELHYYSYRPGLWPIVVGVLKGLAKDHFKFNLNIELLQARGRDEGADHEASTGASGAGVRAFAQTAASA